MRWHPHHYAVATEQGLDVGRLANISEAAAEEADESGYLAGNQMYQDLRGYGSSDVDRSLEAERRFIARLQAAKDLEAEGAESR